MAANAVRDGGEDGMGDGSYVERKGVNVASLTHMGVENAIVAAEVSEETFGAGQIDNGEGTVSHNLVEAALYGRRGGRME